jgi:hypothetical protein
VAERRLRITQRAEHERWRHSDGGRCGGRHRMQLNGATRRSAAVQPRAAGKMGQAARVGRPRRGVAAAGRVLWLFCMLMSTLLLRGEPWVLQSTGVDIGLKATSFLTRCVACHAAVGSGFPSYVLSSVMCYGAAAALVPLMHAQPAGLAERAVKCHQLAHACMAVSQHHLHGFAYAARAFGACVQ